MSHGNTHYQSYKNPPAVHNINNVPWDFKFSQIFVLRTCKVLAISWLIGSAAMDPLNLWGLLTAQQDGVPAMAAKTMEIC